MKKLLSILTIFLGVLISVSPMVEAKGEKSYTYTYDIFKTERQSPDTYDALKMITGEELGIGDFKNPQGVFAIKNELYICDTDNNRIVVLERKDNEFTVKEEIKSIRGKTDIKTLNGPTDIFVNELGERYIADKNNQRVLYLSDKNIVIEEYTKPVDETIQVDSAFLPTKVVADETGRVIVLVEAYNQGFLQFAKNGDFIGYLGANKVKFNPIDLAWKLIATDEQRRQMDQFVPTEYANLTFDKEGFVYAVTAVFDPNELFTGQAKPIRKLNTMGQDILVSNGNAQIMGDLSWGEAGNIVDSSRFSDITVLDNDVYCALDKTRGRIFGYDYQGNLLYAFGGVANKLGYFQEACGIVNMGNDLLVLDSKSAGITIFTPTKFGSLINKGLEEYVLGNYNESGEYWKEVLTLNGNYDLAYIGIGRSLMRQEKYKEAMVYFEEKWDDRNYSKAFQLYRKEWIEENITWMIVVVLIFTGLMFGFKIYKKIKAGWVDDED